MLAYLIYNLNSKFQNKDDSNIPESYSDCINKIVCSKTA